jgi:hypothetical protein
MVLRWPRDNGKIARANPAHHHVMNICAEMHSKVVLNEYSVKVCAWDVVCLNIAANIITIITENIGGGANSVQTSDPLSRALITSTSIQRKSWVPWLDCKDNSDLCVMVVVPILFDMVYRHIPPICAIVFFKTHPKLININELPSGLLNNAKRKRVVPEAPEAELNIRLLSLIGLRERLLLGDVKLLKLLVDGLMRDKTPPPPPY